MKKYIFLVQKKKKTNLIEINLSQIFVVLVSDIMDTDRLTNTSWYCLITGFRLMSCGSSIIALWKAAASLINFPTCEGAIRKAILAADYHACRGELSPRSIVSSCLRLSAQSLQGGEEERGGKWTRVLAHFLHFGTRRWQFCTRKLQFRPTVDYLITDNESDGRW